MIASARQVADVARVRDLFVAYERSLGVSLCFQGFERELATLPGAYAPPRGGLWLATRDGEAVGCVALRPLERDLEDRPLHGVAELKRLYVTPAARGTGLGGRLAQAALGHAGAGGYRAVRLDTLAGMDEARALYRRLGFEPCAPYCVNPLDGVLFMELRL